jgi:hypothetical protein
MSGDGVMAALVDQVTPLRLMAGLHYRSNSVNDASMHLMDRVTSIVADA